MNKKKIEVQKAAVKEAEVLRAATEEQRRDIDTLLLGVDALERENKELFKIVCNVLRSQSSIITGPYKDPKKILAVIETPYGPLSKEYDGKELKRFEAKKRNYIKSKSETEDNVIEKLESLSNELQECRGVYKHAEKELNRLLTGNEEDDDMQQCMNDGILDLVKVFERQGHSGISAPYCIRMFSKVAMYEPLGPLTGDEGEWEDVDQGKQQNKRDSSVFRVNGDNNTAYTVNGKTFSDDGGETFYTTKKSRVKITFPYTPQPKKKVVKKNMKWLHVQVKKIVKKG